MIIAIIALFGIVLALSFVISPVSAGADDSPPPAVKNGETITAKEFDDVFDAMREGDWDKAHKLSEALINRDSPAQRYLLARIRYIFLYTVVTQYEKGDLSMDEVTQELQHLKGKMILQPWHPIRHADKECLNFICNDPDWKDTLVTVQTNRDRSIIYWYEYVNTGKHLDLSSYDMKMARLGGIFKNFSFNEDLMETPRSKVDWYLRIEVEDGYIQYNR